MITTHKQALAVQERRVKAGKRGFAKAVRRYFNQHSKTFKRPSYFANGLPVIWATPNKATATP